ncbi:hypothetical protein M153_12000021443, partial [Pseudoloma neurophilia]
SEIGTMHFDMAIVLIFALFLSSAQKKSSGNKTDDPMYTYKEQLTKKYTFKTTYHKQRLTHHNTFKDDTSKEKEASREQESLQDKRYERSSDERHKELYDEKDDQTPSEYKNYDHLSDETHFFAKPTPTVPHHEHVKSTKTFDSKKYDVLGTNFLKQFLGHMSIDLLCLFLIGLICRGPDYKQKDGSVDFFAYDTPCSTVMFFFTAIICVNKGWMISRNLLLALYGYSTVAIVFVIYILIIKYDIKNIKVFQKIIIDWYQLVELNNLEWGILIITCLIDSIMGVIFEKWGVIHE